MWRSRAELELATVVWVPWFNHDRLHSSLGDIPPVEFEQNHAIQIASETTIPGSGSPLNTRTSLALQRAAL